MNLKIAVSSGKGGTGKTFIATNIAQTLQAAGKSVRYLDCDVEEPNGHLFLKPKIERREEIAILSPVDIDTDRCTGCGRCARVCHYNAIAMVKDKALFFKNLCHVCGACTIVCPENAIIEKQRKIGDSFHGHSNAIEFHYAELETAEGGMSPRLIRRVKAHIGDGINILDSSPGTACPVVETVKDADLCVLVTDPTPFGIHDLKLAVDMCRELEQEPVVLVNRADYINDDLKTYCKEAELDVIGQIPDDRQIAEIYSDGDLVVDELPQYRDLFNDIADRILQRAVNKKAVRASAKSVLPQQTGIQASVNKGVVPNVGGEKSRELVVISGKGGTGKTSIVAAFCALDKKTVIADCDVDAADLHLILNPTIKQKGYFSGSDSAEIDADKCTGCGECYSACRFEAIYKTSHSQKQVFTIDEMACEGCGVCCLVCPEKAVRCEPAINGQWYISDTRFGPMSHAKLGIAEENSGKLVTLVRNNKEKLAKEAGFINAIIDGSPGTGCPVIASVTGADYALVVTEPTVSGIHDLKRVLDVIAFFRVRCGVVVNKFDLNPEKTKEIEAIAQEMKAEFLGTLPYDRRITEAQVKEMSVVEYTDAEISQRIKSIYCTIKNNVFPSDATPA